MQSGTIKTSNNQKYQGSVNPFARALSETEKTSGGQVSNTAHLPDSFSSGLMQHQPFSTDVMRQQQAEQLKKRQAEALKAKRRKELHDRINPVETKDIFSARKKQVEEQIAKLRTELKALAQEVKQFHKEIEVSLLSEVTDPGENGAYYLNFFQKLRALIMLLRQRIRSARTWATQMNTKRKKKKGKKPGLEIAGTKSEKTSTVFDMMHHERSNAYGGS